MAQPISTNPEPPSADPVFQQQVDRLHRLTVYGRWGIVALLWLTIGSFSLWSLRDAIALATENFTWAALRYGLVFNRLAAFGLAVCIGMTVAVLTWQTRNLIWGLPAADRQRLEQQVCRVCHQGRSHPLWKWVCRS